MSKRLVILSDMWGAKKGMWITSYLAYLQPYFDIVFYDCRQLANIDLPLNTRENIYRAFVEGGLDLAVQHLLKKEREPAHYLTFCAGGTIAIDGALKGLPMQSLFAVSPIDLASFQETPDCPITVVFGDQDADLPDYLWADLHGIQMNRIAKYGHELYTDDKVISIICQNILDKFLKAEYDG